MMRVLQDIPGLYKPQVTFVSGTAAFELDNSAARVDEVLPLVEQRTGFKCTRVIEEYQTLDVQMLLEAEERLLHSHHAGIVSVVPHTPGVYRITYDPLIVGARELLSTGAALAPLEDETGVSRERRQLLQKTWMTGLAATFTIPVVVLNWAPNPVPLRTRLIVSLILASVVQALAVREFYIPALKSLIFSRVIEMDMLVVLSITAAYIYSVVAFALVEAGVEIQQGAFFETSALLITLVLFGHLMTALARVRAVRAVSLRTLQVDTFLLLEDDGQTNELDSRLLQHADLMIIRPYSRIVTDGTVVTGTSAVDESMLTGEALPVTRGTGDAVVAGTLNGEGELHVRVTRLPGANSISDISRSVEDALAAKPKVQDLADRVASWFVLIVLAIALVVFATWIGVALGVRKDDAGGAVGSAITYTIAVLAISCPCALGLAVPMVLVVAGGVAARGGVIIKAADAIEKGCKVTDVVFDKTGTLTKGDLNVVRQEMLASSMPQNEALAVAKALVKDDRHPVAKAAATYLSNVDLRAKPLEDIRAMPGAGIQATWGGRRVKAGNPFWLNMEHHSKVASLFQSGLSALCLSIEDVPVLVFGLESPLRDEAAAIMGLLHARQISCHVVSGDHDRAVAAIARVLRIDATETAARQTPQQKMEYVSGLQSCGKTVLFCGDGTNDAVALAQADIGVQLGTASDVASAVADVVLLGGLGGLHTLLLVSKHAHARIVFNFIWAALYNVFAILLAAGAFVEARIPAAYAGLGEIVSVGPVIVVALSMLGNSKNVSA